MARSGKKRKNRLKRKQAYRESQKPDDGRRVIDKQMDVVKLERAAHAITAITRASKHGLTEQQAKTQEAGSILGLALIDGDITPNQFNVGKAIGELLYEWTNQNGHPQPTAQAMDMNRVNGHDDHDEDEERTKQLDRRVDEARASVTDKQWGEITNVCWLNNQVSDLALLKVGLNHLTVN